jgi:hypothetical protein
MPDEATIAETFIFQTLSTDDDHVALLPDGINGICPYSAKAGTRGPYEVFQQSGGGDDLHVVNDSNSRTGVTFLYWLHVWGEIGQSLEDISPVVSSADTLLHGKRYIETSGGMMEICTRRKIFTPFAFTYGEDAPHRILEFEISVKAD